MIRKIFSVFRTLCGTTLRTESPSIFLYKSGRGRNLRFLFPDSVRKDRSDSASRVTNCRTICVPLDENEVKLLGCLENLNTEYATVQTVECVVVVYWVFVCFAHHYLGNVSFLFAMRKITLTFDNKNIA